MRNGIATEYETVDSSLECGIPSLFEDFLRHFRQIGLFGYDEFESVLRFGEGFVILPTGNGEGFVEFGEFLFLFRMEVDALFFHIADAFP